MKTTIFLKNIRFFSHHGVMEQEKIVGNTFLVSLKIDANVSEACSSDDIADTINYAAVYEVVKKEMAIPSKLLEHVGGRIHKRLKEKFSQISSLEVRVEKPTPPIAGEMDTVGVIITD